MSTGAITLKRTDNYNPDFIRLIALLDEYLAEQNGEAHAFYAPNNKLAHLDTAVIAYKDNVPVGCGCFKKFDEDSVEIKRMYVDMAARGKGIATKVLDELEKWAKEIGFTYAVLETGVKFDDALGLYKKWGYHVIDNYGPYAGVNNSVCMQKIL